MIEDPALEIEGMISDIPPAAAVGVEGEGPEGGGGVLLLYKDKKTTSVCSPSVCSPSSWSCVIAVEETGATSLRKRRTDVKEEEEEEGMKTPTDEGARIPPPRESECPGAPARKKKKKKIREESLRSCRRKLTFNDEEEIGLKKRGVLLFPLPR